MSLAKMLVPNDPRPISRTNIVKICVRYISKHFLIIRFHISDEYSSENNFLCLLKSCAKHSWTYITLCERIVKRAHMAKFLNPSLPLRVLWKNLRLVGVALNSIVKDVCQELQNKNFCQKLSSFQSNHKSLFNFTKLIKNKSRGVKLKVDGVTLLTEPEKAEAIASKFSAAHNNTMSSPLEDIVEDGCSVLENNEFNLEALECPFYWKNRLLVNTSKIQ
jgi:hypothetical protein